MSSLAQPWPSLARARRSSAASTPSPRYAASWRSKSRSLRNSRNRLFTSQAICGASSPATWARAGRSRPCPKSSTEQAAMMPIRIFLSRASLLEHPCAAEIGATEAGFMNYDGFFGDAIARLQGERRYRVFAELERIAGRYPRAIWHSPQGPRDVVIWCSNDYLGMGQHPKVIGAMVET